MAFTALFSLPAKSSSRKFTQRKNSQDKKITKNNEGKKVAVATSSSNQKKKRNTAKSINTDHIPAGTLLMMGGKNHFAFVTCAKCTKM